MMERANGSGKACTEPDVWAHTQVSDAGSDGPTYRCQATQLPYATTGLKWWDIRQYVEDYRSGNVTLWRIFCGLTFALYFTISHSGIGVGPAMEWIYDRLVPL